MRLRPHILFAARCLLAAVLAIGLVAPMWGGASAGPVPTIQAATEGAEDDHRHASEDMDDFGHPHDPSGGDHLHEAAAPDTEMLSPTRSVHLRLPLAVGEDLPPGRPSGLKRPPRA